MGSTCIHVETVGVRALTMGMHPLVATIISFTWAWYVSWILFACVCLSPLHAFECTQDAFFFMLICMVHVTGFGTSMSFSYDLYDLCRVVYACRLACLVSILSWYVLINVFGIGCSFIILIMLSLGFTLM